MSWAPSRSTAASTAADDGPGISPRPGTTASSEPERTYELPKAWSIGAKLSAIGGAPYTPYDTEKSSLKEAWTPEAPLLRLFAVQRGRLRAFAQLDLRIDKAFYFRRCTLGIYVDLQNVTGSKLRQPDVLMSTGIVENPSAPASEQRYRMKYIKQESGTHGPGARGHGRVLSASVSAGGISVRECLRYRTSALP